MKVIMSIKMLNIEIFIRSKMLTLKGKYRSYYVIEKLDFQR